MGHSTELLKKLLYFCEADAKVGRQHSGSLFVTDNLAYIDADEKDYVEFVLERYINGEEKEGEPNYCVNIWHSGKWDMDFILHNVKDEDGNTGAVQFNVCYPYEDRSEEELLDKAASLMADSFCSMLPCDESCSSTKATDEDLAEAVADEYGVLYSKDGKKLLKGNVELDVYTVKEGTEIICDEAFECSPFDIDGCGTQPYKIHQINLPSTLEEIGNRAFNLCNTLKDINFPTNLNRIGRSAFSHCDRLRGIILPRSVEHVGDSAFCGCSSLQSVVLSESMTEICEATFAGCNSLQTLVVPESIKKIGELAFKDCSSLQYVALPQTLEEDGDNSFLRCRFLLRYGDKVHVSDGEELYDSITFIK